MARVFKDTTQTLARAGVVVNDQQRSAGRIRRVLRVCIWRSWHASRIRRREKGDSQCARLKTACYDVDLHACFRLKRSERGLSRRISVDGGGGEFVGIEIDESVLARGSRVGFAPFVCRFGGVHGLI